LQLEGENFQKLVKIKIYSTKKENEPLLQGEKGHLVYFMPILAKCITCKDPELKELLRDIFTEVSKELGIEYF